MSTTDEHMSYLARSVIEEIAVLKSQGLLDEDLAVIICEAMGFAMLRAEEGRCRARTATPPTCAGDSAAGRPADPLSNGAKEDSNAT
jgi:alpha-D-ribose 1-methylphosphonate 5-triphosphate synthase subunit PhnG